ncbi:putative DNA-invertase from lambdoid prophage Rac [Paraburkholderia bryophila]|uniref:Putative DNA-invertase from lambdoid prophage Rac n=1 Tax=Paraburkholderia bryophila TaxID=420952 RepID=A0A329C0E1_9BURK|nr:putative DNA-invertase from lambdoid prophage Rac [Paraburkholderia bryophila]
MTRLFAYLRVSTADQTTENQIQEITSAGFTVTPQRVVAETISGSVPAFERKGFAKLVDRLEHADVLVVTRLDRLGRNAMDVRATVERLDAIGVRVHCLALGGVDLTSAAGKMTMGVISAVAEFERDLLIERTQAGLRRAKSEGKTFGRPSALTEAQRATVIEQLNAGVSVAQIAREMRTSRQTIMRVRAGLSVASADLNASVGTARLAEEKESVEQGRLGPDGVPCALIDWSDRRKSRGA